MACRESNKERARDRVRREIIWEQMISVEKAKGEEVGLRMIYRRKYSRASFLIDEPTPSTTKCSTVRKRAYESIRPKILTTSAFVSDQNQATLNVRGWEKEILG